MLVLVPFFGFLWEDAFLGSIGSVFSEYVVRNSSKALFLSDRRVMIRAGT